MSVNKEKRKYVAGVYAKQWPDATILAAQYIEDCEKSRPKMKKVVTEKMAPAICFSRKIASGALEIADILAQKI